MSVPVRIGWRYGDKCIQGCWARIVKLNQVNSCSNTHMQRFTHAFDPKSLVSVKFAIDLFEVLPLELLRFTNLGSAAPISDRAFLPDELLAPISLHQALDIGKLLPDISLLQGFLYRLEIMETLNNLKTQSVWLGLEQGTR